MTRTYTLELTAEDLENVDWVRGRKFSTPTLASKLAELAERARADREADDLRLPWRFEALPRGPHVCWSPVGGAAVRSTEMAKLMSAAPELLKAVKRLASFGAGAAMDTIWHQEVRPLIERALRKVETGIPEDG